MTPERHQQIGELYHRVRALPRDQWPPVLDDACADDPELRREVESLLAANDQAGDFIDTPAIDISARLQNAAAARIPQQIGRYQILSLLGRGGMGEVYRAEDPALQRKVAIKLLPVPPTADAHAVLRFEQEARAASSLNHPNIVTIHEIGEVDGGRFIAMEFVDGQPLSALVGSPMPDEQLIPIARQLAQALAVAHAAGIVHRDVKPENIMLRPDGYVKLLDFGVARLISVPTGTGNRAPTFTRAGAVIGTPRYMSPEQIRGEQATAASDVFALGAVLYELSTGRHASEAAATTSASGMRPHPALADLIGQMLQHKPAARPRATEIEATLEHAAPANALSANRVFAHPRRWLFAGGAVAALATAVIVLYPNRQQPAQQEQPNTAPVRFQVEPPANTAFSPSSASLALSPDGRSLAFTASQLDAQGALMRLWIQSLDSLKARVLPTVKAAGQIFWLQDSQAVAFADTSAQFGLRVVDIAGGSVQPVEGVRLAAAGIGSASRDSGLLVKLAGELILHRIPSIGGQPVPVTSLDSGRGENEHSFPVFLPDGRHFLFLASSAQPEHDGMASIGLLGSDERRPLFKSDSQVVYAQPGFLLYMLADTLLARPFDETTLQLTGEGRPIAEQVERNSASRRGAFTVSQTGVLAYRQHGETQLVWYDRTGRRLHTLGPPGHYRNPALSPDEKTVALGRLEPTGGTWDIWTIDVERQLLARVTSDPSSEDMPTWSPDGVELAFKSDRPSNGSPMTVYRQRLADASPAAPLLTGDPDTAIHMWSRHGLVYSTKHELPRRDFDLWHLPPSGGPVALATTPFAEPFGQLSPDGRWIAYSSNETGVYEIYVAALAPGHRKILVSTGGGTEPSWRKNGRELFYLSGDRQLMAVTLKNGPKLRTDPPRPLFQPAVSALLNSSYTRNQYVVTGDGQRFLVNEPTGKRSLSAITVIVNWPATVNRDSGF